MSRPTRRIREIGNQGASYGAAYENGAEITLENIDEKYFSGLVSRLYSNMEKYQYEANIKLANRLDNDILIIYSNLITYEPDYKLPGNIAPTIENLSNNMLAIVKKLHTVGDNSDKKIALALFNRILAYKEWYDKKLQMEYNREQERYRYSVPIGYVPPSPVPSGGGGGGGDANNHNTGYTGRYAYEYKPQPYVREETNDERRRREYGATYGGRRIKRSHRRRSAKHRRSAKRA